MMEETHPAFQAIKRGCSNGSSHGSTGPESGTQMGEQGRGLFRAQEANPSALDPDFLGFTTDGLKHEICFMGK